jgi:hypothetical protein
MTKRKYLPISMVYMRGKVGSINPTRPPKRKPPESIDTVAGKAFFIKTATEDKYGRWDDDYWTKDGYWVIHRGKQHDIYKVKKVI